jgi:hypothetical protein
MVELLGEVIGILKESHAPSSKLTTESTVLQIIRGSELLSACCSKGQAPARGRLMAPLLLGNSQ